jgi:ubiquinone/menaquinone biosynthesis C-methylase UbiE
MDTDLTRYRGQWGGTIENGEEMWWSEPDRRLAAGGFRARLRRLRFSLDVRQSYLLKFLRRALSRTQGTPELVDFGCGTGGTTLNFSRYLGVPITGLDLFETQLEIARRFAEGTGCRFERLGDAGRIPRADGSIDVVLSLDVLGHVSDIPATLADWARVLKPGGTVALFTESSYSPGDRSLMARLARAGADMTAAVPEHISLFPREKLEEWFAAAGFEVLERASANVGHFAFFPKDYVLLLAKHPGHGALLAFARFWNRVTKLLPFYPLPVELARLALTRLFGANAYGTSYFYELTKKRV